MSDFLNPAIEELKELICATWPEILSENGGKRLWEAEHVALLELDKLPRPFCALIISEQPWTEGALDRNDVMLDVAAYYVADNAGRPNPVRTQAQLLRDALWPDDSGLSLSQVWDDPKPAADWSMRLPANQILRAKKLKALAGVVTFRLLTGEPD